MKILALHNPLNKKDYKMSENTLPTIQSISKDWVDKLLAELQLKIGAREIENSALQVDLKLLREENEHLREQIKNLTSSDSEKEEGESQIEILN